MSNETKKCSFCAETILKDAIKCKHCGEILDSQLRSERRGEHKHVQPRIQKWNPGIAALLSFIIPGAGQMYKGNVGSGLLWFFSVGIGYFLLLIPGIILHLVCIVTATSGDPYK